MKAEIKIGNKIKNPGKFIEKISSLEGVIACRIFGSNNEVEIIYDEFVTTRDNIVDFIDDVFISL